MAINLPNKSNLQPLKYSTPQGNTYKGRDVNIGRIQAKFDGGPALASGVGEGLQKFAGSLGKWYAVLEEQEQKKQTFEAMDQINQSRARQREMLDQMGQMTGASGVAAPYLMEEFYKKEREQLEKSARGDFQKMIYSRFLDSEENRGLDKAMAHRTVELERREQSVMAGDQAEFEATAADWRSTPDDITAAAIPFAQRRIAYLRSKGLDTRSAAFEANKIYHNALLTNATSHILGLADSDPAEARRIASGSPASIRLPQNVSSLADKVGAAKGVDPALLKSIIMAESSGNPGAVSEVGARGLMQLMPGTARDLGVNPDDPEQNVRGGAEYISRMLKKYNGNLKHALMAYNWGPGNFDRWLQKGGKGEVPQETQKYVRKVMADYNLQKGGGRTGGGGSLAHPVPGFTKISSGYGNRNTKIAGASTFHEAIDIPAPIGTPVQATIGGTVSTAEFKGKNGNYIVIDGDDGRQHYFLHLNNFAQGLKPGQRVEQGMEIGAVGNSGTLKIGPHLDYRIKEKGKFIDPERALSGQGQPVMLANNALVGPGDVASDAFGVAAGTPEETAIQMAMPSAEIDPNSSGDWMLGDYAAIFNELASPAQKMKLQAKLDKIQDEQIKAEKEATITRLEQLDLIGELTPQALEADPGLKDLSYEEQIRFRKTADGRAGWMGELKAMEKDAREAKKENWNNTKKDLEARFYTALWTGAIPRTREGVVRWLETKQDYWGDEVLPSDYFDPSNEKTMIADAEQEAGRLNTMVQEFITMNPVIFTDLVNGSGLDYVKRALGAGEAKDLAALHLKFKKVVAERATQLGYKLNDDRIPGLMQQLATDGNFLKGDYQLPGAYSKGNDTVRNELIDDMILSADAPDIGPVRRLVNMAIDQGKTLAEMRAPDADQWSGKGKMTLFGAGAWAISTTRLVNWSAGGASANIRQYKDYFEEAAKYYNIDPDYLAAIAFVASEGQRYATGKLTPGGRGVMQLPEAVAADMGLVGGAEFDPRKNIMAAAQLLNGLLDAGGGDYGTALKMYAAGMPEDYARGFVKEVNRLYNRNYGLHSSANPNPYQLPNYGEKHGSK